MHYRVRYFTEQIMWLTRRPRDNFWFPENDRTSTLRHSDWFIRGNWNNNEIEIKLIGQIFWLFFHFSVLPCWLKCMYYKH